MCALFVILTLALACSGASAAPFASPDGPPGIASITRKAPIGHIEIRVDGSDPIRIAQAGVPGEGADVRFVGEKLASDGSWHAQWSYLADLNPKGNASIRGYAKFSNRSKERRTVQLILELPIDPVIGKESQYGGTFSVSLEMNQDGGVLEVPGTQAGWNVLIDHKVVNSLHKGPFAMRGKAKGVARTSAGLGSPMPTEKGPCVEDGFGVCHQFRLSPGDAVTYTSELMLGGDELNFLRRRETRTPILIGRGDERIMIDLSNSKQRTKRIKGTLELRPAQARDQNTVGRGTSRQRN